MHERTCRLKTSLQGSRCSTAATTSQLLLLFPTPIPVLTYRLAWFLTEADLDDTLFEKIVKHAYPVTWEPAASLRQGQEAMIRQYEQYEQQGAQENKCKQQQADRAARAARRGH